MNKSIDVSVLIVNWNSSQLLMNCIASLFDKTVGISYEIIVIDNASTDGLVDTIKQKFQNIKLIKNNENLGFAAGNNKGLSFVKGNYVLFLNPDTILKNNAIATLVEFLNSHSDFGICSGRLYNEDNTPGVSYGCFPSYWHVIFRFLGLKRIIPRRWHPIYGQPFDVNISEPIIVDWVSGACLCIRTEILKNCGGLDESFFFLFEDVDLCYKVNKLGFKSYFIPHAEIYHLNTHGFKSSRDQFRYNFYISEFIFFKKHFECAYLVYTLNVIQWSLKYLKRSIRKRNKRREIELMLSKIREIQKKG